MNSTFSINNLILNKWQKKLNLKYNWDTKIPAVLAGIYSLSLLAEEVESQYFLAEQEIIINQNPSLGVDFSLKSEIISKRKFDSFSYLKLKSTVSHEDNILITLNSKLIKYLDSKSNAAKKSSIEKELNSNKIFNWRSFSKKEIKTFANLSGDLNSIHLTSDPVVQGMLILLAFEDFLAQNNRFAKRIKIKYLRKSRAEEKINLFEVEHNNFLGLVDKKINFNINIKENLNV